jgi:hypothetical protein
VHRIQETQDALMFALWEAVQHHLTGTTLARSESA